MAAHTYSRIACDHAGCSERTPLGHGDATTVRRAMKALGWVRVRVPRRSSIDLCPDHARQLVGDLQEEGKGDVSR